MKKLFIYVVVLCSTLTAAGQISDPYINVQTVNPVITLNANTVLEVIAGNAGNGTIVANSLRITITAGSNARIMGIAGGDTRWTQQSLSAGSGNTLVMTNTGPGQFNSFDLNNIFVDIKGTAIGGPSTISGNISYIPGTNPLLGGAANSSQGNLSVTNDNSTTSLTVVGGPVAVRLSNFSVSANGCNAQLVWNTASESLFRGFEIEHSSDGIIYRTIGRIEASGGSAGANYSFTNLQTIPRAFYRLKMIDTDGTIHFSRTLHVTTRCNEKTVLINPNPVLENQSITVTLSGYNGKVKGELISINGQLAEVYQLQNGVNTINLSNKLANGTYQLKITSEGGEASSFKLVKN